MDNKDNSMIIMKDIFKTYVLGDIEIPVLRGISLNIDKGEFVAIMGPSGSGKTTLMNIIGFLDRPTSGDYYLDNVHMQTLKDKDLARIRNLKIGFVFQQFQLLPRMNAIENVELPLIYAGVSSKKERTKRAIEALNSVGLSNRLKNRPNELSGGQQQRVAIARALVNNPAIILADEPTGALDSKTSEEILNIFKDINDQGRTIIMITHDKEVGAKAKRMIRVRDGEIESPLVI